MNKFAHILQVSEECYIKNIYGDFRLRVFRIETSPENIFSIATLYVLPLFDGCLTRINSACITSETFGDTQCDCKWQLEESFRMIAKAKNGIIIYLSHHEGRGVGLFHKVQTMNAMENDKSLCSATAFQKLHLTPDLRNYDCVMPILNWFGVNEIRMITNNPEKIKAQENLGVNVIDRIPLVSEDASLQEYLNKKKEKFGHIISNVPTPLISAME